MSEKNDENGKVHDNAPFNPLSPHADDPDFEPRPTHEPEVGHGGEYDQVPYTDQREETTGETGRGEYDQKNYRDRQAGRPDGHDS
ncbi:hypothetical protein [Flaviflexus massiliensis]|uniref:hypothetical protein n=1 Tax=Flaviflexus massiliensis TaxID=1522309 RepID=UPI0006D52EF4|nr:hypothetical protein [Flaviflexus massiliensis]